MPGCAVVGHNRPQPVRALTLARLILFPGAILCCSNLYKPFVGRRIICTVYTSQGQPLEGERLSITCERFPRCDPRFLCSLRRSNRIIDKKLPPTMVGKLVDGVCTDPAGWFVRRRRGSLVLVVSMLILRLHAASAGHDHDGTTHPYLQ